MTVTQNNKTHIQHHRRLLLALVLFTCLGWINIAAQETPTPEPHYGTIELSPGFTPPYTIDTVIEGGEFNLFELDGVFATRTACAGFATRAPLVVIHWTAATNNNTLYFRFEGTGGDPTMYLQVSDGVYGTETEWCNDDHNAQPNPLFGFTSLPGDARIAIWIGTYYPGETITGTLTIAQSQNAANPAPAATAAPQYGPIRSHITKLGGLLIEEYCRAKFDGLPDARHYNYASLTWGCFPQAPDSEGIEIELSEVCRWQYGEGAYAVQDGDNFRTYACYYRGDYDPNTLIPDRPSRAETTIDFVAALEALEAVSPGGLEAEYCVAPLYILPEDLTRLNANPADVGQITLQTLQSLTITDDTDSYLVFDPAALSYNPLALAGLAPTDATITERQRNGVVFADAWDLTIGQDAIWSQEGNFWQIHLSDENIGTTKLMHVTETIQANLANCQSALAASGRWRCTGIDLVYHCTETATSAD